MRIVYLLPELGKTGGSFVLYNFMNGLLESGHDVYVVTTDNFFKWEIDLNYKIKPNRKDNILKRGVKTFSKKIIGKYYGEDLVLLYKHLIKVTRNLVKNFNKNIEKADIIISTMSLTAFANYLLLSKCNFSLYHIQHYEELFFESSKFMRNIVRSSYLLPLQKLVNSNWLNSIFKNIYNMDSYILNPGIDLNIFNPKIDFKEKYKKIFNEYIIFSYTDSKRIWKGTYDLFEAMKIVWKEFGNSKIKWVTFGPSFPDSIKGYNVEYKGEIFLSELSKLYSEAYLTVNPSWYESFPLQPLESMACGTTVITTLFGTEDYAFNNVNSLTLLPRNIEELAKKIIYLIKNQELAMQLANEGIKTAKKFEWSKSLNNFNKFIDNLNSNNINKIFTKKLDYLTDSLLEGKNLEDVFDITYK